MCHASQIEQLCTEGWNKFSVRLRSPELTLCTASGKTFSIYLFMFCCFIEEWVSQWVRLLHNLVHTHPILHRRWTCNVSEEDCNERKYCINLVMLNRRSILFYMLEKNQLTAINGFKFLPLTLAIFSLLPLPLFAYFQSPIAICSNLPLSLAADFYLSPSTITSVHLLLSL